MPVRATVTATSRGFAGRAFAGADGAFQFTKLPAGSYFLCAQVPSMLAGPKDNPFIDSCATLDISSPLALAAGQARTGLVVSAKRGQLLKIRINDVNNLLPPLAGRESAAALSLTITGPSGLHQRVPITNHDAGGRTHTIVIPFGAPHKLFIQSAGFLLRDSDGRDLDGATPVSVLAPPAPGGTALTYVVNVVKAVKP